MPVSQLSFRPTSTNTLGLAIAILTHAVFLGAVTFVIPDLQPGTQFETVFLGAMLDPSEIIRINSASSDPAINHTLAPTKVKDPKLKLFTSSKPPLSSRMPTKTKQSLKPSAQENLIAPTVAPTSTDDWTPKPRLRYQPLKLE